MPVMTEFQFLNHGALSTMLVLFPYLAGDDKYKSVRKWLMHIIVKDMKQLGGIIFVMSISSSVGSVMSQYIYMYAVHCLSVQKNLSRTIFQPDTLIKILENFESTHYWMIIYFKK